MPTKQIYSHTAYLPGEEKITSKFQKLIMPDHQKMVMAIRYQLYVKVSHFMTRFTKWPLNI